MPKAIKFILMGLAVLLACFLAHTQTMLLL